MPGRPHVPLLCVGHSVFRVYGAVPRSSSPRMVAADSMQRQQAGSQGVGGSRSDPLRCLRRCCGTWTPVPPAALGDVRRISLTHAPSVALPWLRKRVPRSCRRF